MAGSTLIRDEHLPAAERLEAWRQALSQSRMAPVEVQPDDHGREVPRGTVGEIVARGGNVMRGYWNRPEETAEALRDGWMRTGDAGHMDGDGYVHLVDRLKDMIIVGGSNVYSAEVENALGAHPAVAAYKTPRSFELVEALPIAPTGNVLKRELRRPHWEGMDRQIH